MANTCVYCGKPGVVKAKGYASESLHWLCAEHAKSAQKVQDGKNHGVGAGIG